MLIRDFIKNITELTTRGNRYINKLLNVGRLLYEFDNSLKVQDFSEAITSNFIQFLRDHHKQYRPNTIRAYYQILCYILNRASKEFSINSGYMNITVFGELSQTVYLTMDEIKAIYELKDISKRAAIIRDYFIIMCFTGLRLSDAKRLSTENITQGRIIIKTQKTKSVVEILIHPYVSEIFSKWNNKPPGCSTQQAFYKTLQRLCKYAGIVEDILVERQIGNTIERNVYKKYQLVTPHTGRRTFATNIYLSSKENYIPICRIMLLTGHKTEESFFRYIRINRKENADVLSEHVFFNS